MLIPALLWHSPRDSVEVAKKPFMIVEFTLEGRAEGTILIG